MCLFCACCAFAAVWRDLLTVWLIPSSWLGWCGQTVRRIKLNLGVQVGLGPGHIMLDADPAHHPPKGHSHQFSAHICCGQMAGWIKIPIGTKVRLGQGDFVLDGEPAPPPQKRVEPQIFGLCLLWLNGWVDQDATWYGDRPLPKRHCVRWEPRSPPQKKNGHSPQ